MPNFSTRTVGFTRPECQFSVINDFFNYVINDIALLVKKYCVRERDF